MRSSRRLWTIASPMHHSGLLGLLLRCVQGQMPASWVPVQPHIAVQITWTSLASALNVWVIVSVRRGFHSFPLPQAQQQQTSKARDLYRSALKANSSHMQSILGLAVLEARLGRPRMALKIYMRGLQIEPNNIQLLHASAQLLQQQGQIEVGYTLQ